MLRRYDRHHRSPGWPLTTALLASVLLLPCTARAGPQVWLLAPGESPTRPGGPLFMDCADLTATQRFSVYVQPDIALTGVTSFDLDVLIESSWPWLCPYQPPPPPLPPLWRFAEGACNEGGLVPTGEPPALTYGYRSMWSHGPPAVAYDAAMGADTLREAYIAEFHSSVPVDLEANRIYYVGQLLLPQCAAATCSGCNASLFLNVTDAIAIGSSPSYYLLGETDLGVNIQGVCATAPPPPDPSVFKALMGTRKPVAVAATVPACNPVPARHETWGHLKQLYR
jgi:hypothetical protein